MFDSPLFLGSAIFVLVSAGIGIAGYLVAKNADPEYRALRRRIRHVGDAPKDDTPARPGVKFDFSALVKFFADMGAAQTSQTEKARTMLLQAGYFSPSAPQIYLGVKLALAVVLLAVGVAAAYFTLPAAKFMSPWLRVCFGGLIGLNVGLMGPGYWLSSRVEARRKAIRQSLPDALDMLVLCLEGGTSLQAAFQRVTDEVKSIHAVLGVELAIAQREMLLGLTPGEALQKFATRCGLAEVRELSLVLLQSERFGASAARVLREHSDRARQDRRHAAEENAQKASVKILFPTLLCIFPAIFIVVLGPAAIQISKLFAR